MITTGSRGAIPISPRPALAPSEALRSDPYVMVVSVPSSWRRWMWVRSGVRSACHRSASISVPVEIGAATPSETGVATDGSMPPSGGATALRRIAATSALGLSASAITESGSLALKARSSRSISSTRSRLLIPRSRSSESSSEACRTEAPPSSATRPRTISSTCRSTCSTLFCSCASISLNNANLTELHRTAPRCLRAF